MKVPPKRKLGIIIRTGPSISAALLAVGAGRRFYVGEVRGGIWTFTPGGEGAGRRQAPGSRDAGMGCAVRRPHRFGGQDLRGCQLRELRHEKTATGRFFSPHGSRRVSGQCRAWSPLRLIKAWGAGCRSDNSRARSRRARLRSGGGVGSLDAQRSTWFPRPSAWPRADPTKTPIPCQSTNFTGRQ